MKYHIIIANPAGNITVFVLDDVPPAQFIPLSQRLMALPELHAEQVGFWKPAKLGAEARLEMMGGEFCGNATRSFGMLAAARAGKTGKVSVTVECSGAAELLPVAVDFDAGEAETVMPRPVKLGTLDAAELGALPIVFFEGIFHVILPGFAASRALFERIRTLVEAQYAFDALGVMFLNEAEGSMEPAVYVKSTDSLVFESSCGSGTVATGVWMSRNTADGTDTYYLKQPGGTLKATVVKCGGAVTEVRMGGLVTLSPQQEIDV